MLRLSITEGYHVQRREGMVQEIPVDEKKFLLKMTLISQGLVPNDEREWDALIEHIDVHKYFRNEELDFTIEWGEAVFSWIETVYEPLIEVVDRETVRMAFPDMSRAELMFAISTHWHYLKEKDPEISAGRAAEDFISRFARRILARL
jgi:hypothetical protein